MNKYFSMRGLALHAVLGLLAAAFTLNAAAHTAHADRHGASASKASAELATSAAMDKAGRLWVVTKEAVDGAHVMTLKSSSDMGKTWSAASRIQQDPEPVAAKGEERPKIAFGSKGEIYIAYTLPIANPHIGDIRFVRSTDDGKTFSKPLTVHANRDAIAHAFGSMIVDQSGRIYIAWIDGRDREKAKREKKSYAGSAIYYAVSDDGGATFKGDYKIADHSCECCRIALALGRDGHPLAMWRHVFEPNVRDHALVALTPDGRLSGVVRASFDDWRIDACPHHGPGLAFGADGTRHQTWFNGKENGGGVFYAAASPSGKSGTPIRLGSDQARHADVAAHGKSIVLAWKQFDGKVTVLLGKVSHDGGATWKDMVFAQTDSDSDQPHLFTADSGIMLVWRTQNEGVRILQTNTGA